MSDKLEPAVIVIPARIGSTRFPGKPLAQIAGKTLIQRTWEQAKKAQGFTAVWIATDSEKIAEHATSFGAEVIMTPSELPSGTDRVAFVAQEHPNIELFVNLQGDAPLTPPSILEALHASFSNPNTNIATPALPLTGKAKSDFYTRKQGGSTTGTTVVFDCNHQALYFSKQILPFCRDNAVNDFPIYQHLGVYAYRRKALLALAALPQGQLEICEKLEQLRALENGMPITIVPCPHSNVAFASVDEPKDITIVTQLLQSIEGSH